MPDKEFTYERCVQTQKELPSIVKIIYILIIIILGIIYYKISHIALLSILLCTILFIFGFMGIKLYNCRPQYVYTRNILFFQKENITIKEDEPITIQYSNIKYIQSDKNCIIIVYMPTFKEDIKTQPQKIRIDKENNEIIAICDEFRNRNIKVLI